MLTFLRRILQQISSLHQVTYFAEKTILETRSKRHRQSMMALDIHMTDGVEYMGSLVAIEYRGEILTLGRKYGSRQLGEIPIILTSRCDHAGQCSRRGRAK